MTVSPHRRRALMLPLLGLLLPACARPPSDVTAPITTVIVEPPPEAAPLEGCVRVNPTCTYQALAVEFGRLPELPDACEGRLAEAGTEGPVGTARVDGLAHLSGPASWDILQDIQALAGTTFETCYEEGLRLTPTLSGAMELEFQVEQARSCVSEIVVVDTDLEDTITRDCVVNALMGYPLPSAGSRMSARLVFEPGE